MPVTPPNSRCCGLARIECGLSCNGHQMGLSTSVGFFFRKFIDFESHIEIEAHAFELIPLGLLTVITSNQPCRPYGRRPRVLLIGPSLDILGGQAIQAARLMHKLAGEHTISASFLPINPRLPW